MDDPKPKKLTLSCSRCRAAKLKCDRKEPCLECIKRDCAHLCTKDVRQPRAKRTKTQQTKRNISQEHAKKEEDPDVEETALALEHFVDATPFCGESEGVAPDIPNRYWATQNPHRNNQKLELIRDVVGALPEWDIIQTLYEVFVTRCQGSLGNIVHTPSFMKQADQLKYCLSLASPEIAIINTTSLDSLAVLLLALVLGLAFHPTPCILGFQPTPLSLQVEEIRASNGLAPTWRSLGLRCLQGSISLFCGSIPSLQAAIMILLDSKETSLELDSVLVTAIAGARRLGLHQLGSATLIGPSLSNDASATSEPPRIRTEIAVRIWWALVMRDWSRGQALGYYTIRASEFNTRMPLHLNDDDLCMTSSEILERPRSEFTMLSYTAHALELSIIVRESIDFTDNMKDATERRQALNQKYEKYIAELPSYFRLGSTIGLTDTGTTAAIPVQRFMLHQQLWSLLLRIHRITISSPIGHASCQQLAHNIITTQAQIQARCTVCDSLASNEAQIFNATVVLVLGLLFGSPSTKSEASSSQLSRLMTRDHIREAIELLRAKVSSRALPQDVMPQNPLQNGTSRSVLALEALMDLEGDSTARDNRTVSTNKNQHLYHRVAGILRGLNDSINHSDSKQGSLSTPEGTLDFYTPTADWLPDLDIMPIVSNGISADMLEYLDFYSLNGNDNENLEDGTWPLVFTDKHDHTA